MTAPDVMVWAVCEAMYQRRCRRCPVKDDPETLDCVRLLEAEIVCEVALKYVVVESPTGDDDGGVTLMAKD